MDQPTPLAQYVINLHERWRKNRQPFDEKCRKNLAASESEPTEIWKKSENDAPWMSDAIMPLTRQKCTALHAVGTDVYLAGDQVPFVLQEDQDGPVERQQEDPALAQATKDAIAEHEALMRRQDRACEAVEELTKCWHSGVIYGDYWAKWFTGTMDDDRFVENPPGSGIAQQVLVRTPAFAFKYVSVWSMFWDMEASSLETGDGSLEEDYVCAYDLREMLAGDDQFLLPDAVLRAIRNAGKGAGVGSDGEDSAQRDNPRFSGIVDRSRNIRWREFWGRVPRKTVEDFMRLRAEVAAREAAAAGGATEQATTMPTMSTPSGTMEAPTDLDMIAPEERGDMVEVQIVMAGNEIIRFAPSSVADRPYVHGVMEARLDKAYGRGMPDNVENEQKSLNGMQRAVENSAKLASNLILAIKERYLMDPSSLDKLFPGMKVALAEDCDDARKAIQQVVLEFIGDRLLPLMTMTLEFADMSSNLPRAQQGMQALNPQTAYELQQRLERSGKYVGRVVKNFDVFVQKLKKVQFRRNTQDPENGLPIINCRVVAIGFAAFEQTVVRMQKLLQLLGLALQSPTLEIMFKMRELVEEVVKSMRVDPDTVLKSQEQWQADVAAQAESENAKLQTALAQAEVALTGANAQKSGAQAAQTVEKVRQDDERIEIERAKLVMEAERHVKEQEQPAQAPAKGAGGGMRRNNPKQGAPTK